MEAHLEDRRRSKRDADAARSRSLRFSPLQTSAPSTLLLDVIKSLSKRHITKDICLKTIIAMAFTLYGNGRTRSTSLEHRLKPGSSYLTPGSRSLSRFVERS